MTSWGLQDLKKCSFSPNPKPRWGNELSRGKPQLWGSQWYLLHLPSPLPGLQSCLQPDMPLNLLITSGLVCLWKRSLPPGELPGGRRVPGVLGALARCYPVAVPRDWHSCRAFQASREHRDGTREPPSWHHRWCRCDGPMERGGYWEQSPARPCASIPTHLMRVMRVPGLRWESQGRHGACVSLVNTRPNSGSQEG